MLTPLAAPAIPATLMVLKAARGKARAGTEGPSQMPDTGLMLTESMLSARMEEGSKDSRRHT